MLINSTYSTFAHFGFSECRCLVIESDDHWHLHFKGQVHTCIFKSGRLRDTFEDAQSFYLPMYLQPNVQGLKRRCISCSQTFSYPAHTKRYGHFESHFRSDTPRLPFVRGLEILNTCGPDNSEPDSLGGTGCAHWTSSLGFRVVFYWEAFFFGGWLKNGFLIDGKSTIPRTA